VLGQAVPTIPDHKRAEFDAAVAQNRRGVATLYETQRRRKDGTLIDVISSTAPLVDARGRVTGSMGVLVDLAEQKQLEEQLRQSQKMEAVGQLAGGIAHDFNNLLTVIGGRTYLLLTTLPEKHPARPNVELIQETAERAAVLTRQLLAFSRKQILALQVLDLNTIVASIERILRRLIGEHIHLVIEPSSTPGLVKVDPGQMEQVILNLSVNARDAMPGGGRLTIRTAHVDVAEAAARTHAEIQAGPAVVLEVRDTGIGMTDEIRTRIFEPFFTTKPAGHGTGLGLATVYGIVKQSGGTIEVLSRPGQGSTFQIYLPRVEETEATSPTDAPAPRHIGGSETILLVEDAEDVRNLARDILGLMGYNLMTASNPVEAIQVSQDHTSVIHLLLTDVVMPGMSGRQLADRLVADRPGLKVLFMSGYTDNAIVHHGVLDPGTAFVQKPFTPDSLSRKVREVLDAS
jgi:two-component system cell cycle sensor histidine kinase/response regulator CckA